MESDETRIFNAAHLMVASLAGSLAHVTCKVFYSFTLGISFSLFPYLHSVVLSLRSVVLPLLQLLAVCFLMFNYHLWFS